MDHDIENEGNDNDREPVLTRAEKARAMREAKSPEYIDLVDRAIVNARYRLHHGKWPKACDVAQ